MYMVKNLLQWSDPMINGLADEAIMVLNCIESSHFPYDAVNDESLPLIRSILHQSTSFKYFYHNRVVIIGAVTKLLNNVCVRAFTDIVKEVQYMKAVREKNLELENIYGASPYVKQVVYHHSPLPGVIVSPQAALPPPQPWNEGSSTAWENNTNLYLPQETYGVSNQHFNDLVAMMNQTSITAATSDENQEVPLDDRIIFMTFSKGYPISEAEVRGHFARYTTSICSKKYISIWLDSAVY